MLIADWVTFSGRRWQFYDLLHFLYHSYYVRFRSHDQRHIAQVRACPKGEKFRMPAYPLNTKLYTVGSARKVAQSFRLLIFIRVRVLSNPAIRWEKLHVFPAGFVAHRII